jgi:hypothetical protein
MKGPQRRKTTTKLGPCQRIMRAAGRGEGVRLDAEEVRQLSEDHNMRIQAELDDALQVIAKELS